MARLLITRGRPDIIAPSAQDTVRPADEPARLRRRWVLLLVAGWLCQAGLRAWFSRGQVIPLANPDESAYLVAARVLAGGPGADFSGSTLYQGGYPLLIAPVFWFAHNPVTVYRTVLLINAALGALIMPLGYLACRRLSLGRPAAYGAATVAALLPAGFFYSQYAMTDAIYPVLVLAWLLTMHSWLTADSVRERYAAAIGSALLTGYAYGVHSRGLVMAGVFAAGGLLAAIKRWVPRGSAVAAGVALVAAAGLGWALDRYLAGAIYPEGVRSLSAEAATRLHSVHGVVNVAEMAVGQLWRLVLDGWGLAGLGLAATVAAIAWRGLRDDLRIMAVVAAVVTVATACTAPAALPPDQSQTWASGRYLDGMIIVFFLVGFVLLMRGSVRVIFGCAAGVTAVTLVAAVTVAAYAGAQLPEAGFGAAFNFGEPAVLTQNWNRASVALATVVALALMLLWIGMALAFRGLFLGRLALDRWRTAGMALLGACLAVVSLVAVAQMTSDISRAGTVASERATTALATVSGPGSQVAIASTVAWPVAVPQTFEVWWTEAVLFNAGSHPPAGTTVVEMPWTGQSAQDSWSPAPPGWHVVASSKVGGWVIWKKS
ncbi:MAG TPA: phospholipid carrier-dependent glycosyltransferase [Streptosporangiaceae bacterium]